MGSRKSRRSACDLCRFYKLRCDRDERHGRPCGRCNTANQPCKITLGHPSQAPTSDTQGRESMLNATTITTAGTAATSTNLESGPLLDQPDRSPVPASGIGVCVPNTLYKSATAGPSDSLGESVPCENGDPMFSDHQSNTVGSKQYLLHSCARTETLAMPGLLQYGLLHAGCEF